MSRLSGIGHGLSHVRGDGTGSTQDAILGGILLAVIFTLVFLVDREIIPRYMGWIIFFIVCFILFGLFPE